MRYAAATSAVSRLNPTARRDNGRDWRRHLRRNAPVPGQVPPFTRQRVHNVYHHLADLSLPYELWNENAELAAIAHLLGNHEIGTAARIYVETVQAYLTFNRRFEPAVKSFSKRNAFAKVWRVAAVREQLPVGSSDADVYAAALAELEKEQGYDYPPIAV